MRGGPPGSPERHTYGPYHFWIGTHPCVIVSAFDKALEERSRLGRIENRRPLTPEEIARFGELEWLVENLEAHECTWYPDRIPIKGHHVKSIKSGGRDHANEVPACFAAHQLFHRRTKREIHATLGIDLEKWAEALAEGYPGAS